MTDRTSPPPAAMSPTELASVLSGETAKGYSDGTQRTVPPEETLARIRTYLPRAGITRLADITGLDSLGIPVTLAVRPNGRVLSVSSGKGLTTAAALVSGAMESIELHHAEVEWSPRTVRRSYAEMRAEHLVPDAADLPLARSAPFPHDWPYLWTWGWDLAGAAEVALPVSMIHMGNRHARVFDLFSFQVTSNGLASGNTLAEALLSGLLEVIERDAVTCHTERWRNGTPPPLFDLDAVAFPSVVPLLDRLAAAKARAIVFDCTLDTGVPVYMAHVVDESGLISGTFTGYGAHLDPEIALSRAITEAAQARTVIIAGSRDDIYRHRDLARRVSMERWREWQDGAGDLRTVRPDPLSRSGATFEEDIRTLLARLRAAGLERVVAVDLSTPHFPVSVVKVVVPGLEGYRMENYAPGRRARRAA
ncbi:YcaO-like family protein [Nonomuraea rubra]|uniref:Ribosomal protein S12 methylthiotransferase accessory factor n=1 Tax=Nonomuraea rubra TaxID=46180 RepID=A0A7X0TX66_9ACTN|nr:YcaO-like family protein [Nonomuraea rubra]MBB6547262.1 ribosomal protein S12 methylthiotransferase accessory factor [Nonomuraea rubra]